MMTAGAVYAATLTARPEQKAVAHYNLTLRLRGCLAGFSEDLKTFGAIHP